MSGAVASALSVVVSATMAVETLLELEKVAAVAAVVTMLGADLEEVAVVVEPAERVVVPVSPMAVASATMVDGLLEEEVGTVVAVVTMLEADLGDHVDTVVSMV